MMVNMKTIILMSILCVSLAAFADISNEIKVYESCYKKFTGLMFSTKSLYAANVLNGSMLGKDACMSLLDRGNLSVQTANGVRLPTDANGKFDDIGVAIVRNFHQVHGSFVGEGFNGGKGDDLALIYDYNSPSQYFTKHLLTANSANYPFSKTFSDNKSYRTIRDDPFNPDRIQYWGPQHGRHSYGVSCNSNCTLKIGAMRIPQYLIDRNQAYSPYQDEFGNGATYQRAFSVGDVALTGSHNAALDFYVRELAPVQHFGTIVGFEDSPVVSFENLWMLPTGINMGRLDGYRRNYLHFNSLRQPNPFPANNIFHNPGLGALTAPEKVLSTVDFSDGEGPGAGQDGANRVPRKWSQSFFKETLCRDLPVMRLEDSAAYVERPANPELKFRNSVFCMGCHASMDGLAYLTRNYRKANSSAYLAGTVPLDINAYLKPFLPSEISNIKYAHLKDKTARPTPDQLFPYRMADADFRFRDMYGILHNVHLTATADDPQRSYRQLASYIGTLDDTYACFASKYLDYLTGIKVKLFDPGASDAPKLTAREKALYSFLIQLAKDFKGHQSARLLIKDIVSSELFLHPYDGQVPGASK
jgi:hypothetical protein